VWLVHAKPLDRRRCYFGSRRHCAIPGQASGVATDVGTVGAGRHRPAAGRGHALARVRCPGVVKQRKVGPYRVSICTAYPTGKRCKCCRARAAELTLRAVGLTCGKSRSHSEPRRRCAWHIGTGACRIVSGVDTRGARVAPAEPGRAAQRAGGAGFATRHLGRQIASRVEEGVLRSAGINRHVGGPIGRAIDRPVNQRTGGVAEVGAAVSSDDAGIGNDVAIAAGQATAVAGARVRAAAGAHAPPPPPVPPPSSPPPVRARRRCRARRRNQIHRRHASPPSAEPSLVLRGSDEAQPRPTNETEPATPASAGGL